MPNDASIVLRPATAGDSAGVTACVCAAYIHYIERIGKQPGPMLENYAEVIAERQVHVATDGEAIVGVLVLEPTAEGFYLDNVAVHPAVRGKGVGKRLLERAELEAQRQGYQSIYLATHEKMTENRDLYLRIGYVEFDHRVINGYPRVFFRMKLRESAV